MNTEAMKHGVPLLQYLLSNYFVAQKRTGRNKQFVFYCGDKIYKGPYSKDKIYVILSRSETLKKWGTPLIVHPLEVEGDFLVYPNLAKDYAITEYEVNTESFTSTVGNAKQTHTYKVAKRVGLDKVNNVLETNFWIYESVDLLEAMAHLWILRVGDTGLFNILADPIKNTIHVIDYDEVLGSDRDDSCFYFSKLPAKKFEWYDRTKNMYSIVAEKLSRLGSDIPRVATAISLLMQYAAQPKSTLVVSNTPAFLGKMEWHGLFGGTTTYSGFKLDEVKSGMQKYIRRGMVEKAQQCAIEIYRLREVTDNAAVMTNLYNRLKIIAVEDVSLAGYNTAMYSMHLINNVELNMDILLAIVESLARSKKTRICSHANASYCNPNGRAYAKTHGVKVMDPIVDKKYAELRAMQKPFSEIENETLRNCAIMLYKCLDEQDFNALTWYAEFIQINAKTKLRYAYKGKRTTDPIVYLFEVLEMFQKKEVVEIIRKAFFTLGDSKRNDKWFFLIFAILSCIYELEYDEGITLTHTADTNRLMRGEYNLVLDEYVYDKHTAKGAHKSRKTFVTEGAHVNNEDPKYHIKELVNVYVNYAS